MLNSGGVAAKPAVRPVIVLTTRTEPERGVIGLFTLICTPAGSLGTVNVTDEPETVPADAAICGGSQPKFGVVGGRAADSVTVQVAPTGTASCDSVWPSTRLNVPEPAEPQL